MEWIDLNKQKPDKEAGYLVFFKNNNNGEEWIETSYYLDEHFYGTIGRTELITHWMPLPEHPKNNSK